MTYLGKIAQLVRDLRELQVIQEEDKITYGNYGAGMHQIVITTGKDSDKQVQSVSVRYGVIYNAFSYEFSQQEIVTRKFENNKIDFVISESN